MSSHQPPRIRLPKLDGINSHVLTVGRADYRLGYGIPVDFSSIGAAMDAIPLFPPDGDHNPVEQWTILVTPGYYPEVIRFKPFVNVVGLVKEAVIIANAFGPGQVTNTDVDLQYRAQVYLCSHTLLSNVTLAIQGGDSQGGDFVVRGYDVNLYPPHRKSFAGDVHDLGLSNVDFYPFPPLLPPPNKQAGLIKFDGNWHTAIFRNVGGNYNAPEGHGIELIGQYQEDTGLYQNSDCHFMDCFFDALFLTGNGERGFVYVGNCFEAHLRNSLIRVGVPQDVPAPGVAAVRTRNSGKEEFLVNVLIEGSSLYGPGPR